MEKVIDDGGGKGVQTDAVEASVGAKEGDKRAPVELRDATIAKRHHDEAKASGHADDAKLSTQDASLPPRSRQMAGAPRMRRGEDGTWLAVDDAWRARGSEEASDPAREAWIVARPSLAPAAARADEPLAVRQVSELRFPFKPEIGGDLRARSGGGSPGGGGLPSDVPESGVLLRGNRWEVVGETLVSPVHVALLPDRSVLCFGGSEHDRRWQRRREARVVGGVTTLVEEDYEAYYYRSARYVDRAEIWTPGGSRILGGVEIDPTGSTPVASPALRERYPDGPGYDAFCCGHAWAGEFGLLIAGGTDFYSPETGDNPAPPDDPNYYAPQVRRRHHLGHYSGVNDASMYLPAARSFVPVPPMHGQWDESGSIVTENSREIEPNPPPPRPLEVGEVAPPRRPIGGGRWYPAMVSLHDGRVLTLGGHPTDDDSSDEMSSLGPGYPRQLPVTRGDSAYHENLNIEIFDPWRMQWFDYGPTYEDSDGGRAVYGLAYCRMHLLPDGRVLLVNPSVDRSKRTVIWDPESYVPPRSRAERGTPRSDRQRWTVLGSLEDRRFRPAHVQEADNYGCTSVLLPLRPPWTEWSVLLVGHDGGYGVNGMAQVLSSRDLDAGWRDFPINDASETPIAGQGMRVHGTATLLPDQTVLVSGGIQNTAGLGGSVGPGGQPVLDFADGGRPYDFRASLTAVRFREGRPANASWERLATATVPRNYHSTALLLPDATVWTGGSNRDSVQGGHIGTQLRPMGRGLIGARWTAQPELRFATDDFSRPSPPPDPTTTGWKEKRVEIYSPPYLHGDALHRPAIRSVTPPQLGLGFSCLVEIAPNARPNRDWQVVLMRCGSATHAFDGDQRCVVLRVLDVSGQRIVAQTPPNTRVTRGALPAGWYMLFVLDTRGVPSEAAMVLVRNR